MWIGGRAGWPRATTPGVSYDLIVKFTMAGKLVMKIGNSGRSKGNLDTENVHQATDVFVDTSAKEVYAADGYGNRRAQTIPAQRSSPLGPPLLVTLTKFVADFVNVTELLPELLRGFR